MSVHPTVDDKKSEDGASADVSGLGSGSHLYLKISAIASYFTTNNTLMERPEPVLVDIILDEYLLGALPRSLLNVGLFIVLLVAVAWYLGIWVVRWINDITKKDLKGKAE